MKYPFRLSSLATLLLAAIAGAALFWVSQQVQQLEREQRLSKSNLEQEREAMRVLIAEWDYLNRPDRLEILVSRHLQMVPPMPDNLIRDANAIPEPLPSEEEVPLLAATGESEKPKETEKEKISTTDPLPIRDHTPTPSSDFNDVLESLGNGSAEP